MEAAARSVDFSFLAKFSLSQRAEDITLSPSLGNLSIPCISFLQTTFKFPLDCFFSFFCRDTQIQRESLYLSREVAFFDGKLSISPGCALFLREARRGLNHTAVYAEVGGSRILLFLVSEMPYFLAAPGTRKCHPPRWLLLRRGVTTGDRQ